MATVPTAENVTITINEVELSVPAGELIVESVKRLGLEIPIFCYHPRLKPVGMCRMCLVEVGFRQPDGTVRRMPKPQAGCTLPASEGMAVYTDSEMVHRDRKGVLEFLLINHPLDCPICDRGGECPLQNNTLAYGPSTSRFVELKRHAIKAFPLSRYVTLDLERCIQCGRCVRFTEEISGDAQLAFRFRGAEMQPSTFELTDFTSRFSGNTIEICPVGALTSSEYRFRSRPWDLETKEAICTVCSNGCNVWFDHRVGKFVRINGRSNEAVNEEWTCDRGKFGHGFYNSSSRLKSPLIRKGGKFVESTWSEAYEAILRGFASKGKNVAGLARPDCSNESLYLFQKLFRGVFETNNIDSRWTKTLPSEKQSTEALFGFPSVQTGIQDLESKAKVLVFGAVLEDELPIFYLRLRKAATQKGCRVILVGPAKSEVATFAEKTLAIGQGSEMAHAAALLHHLVNSGMAKVPEATRKQLESAQKEFEANYSDVSSATISQIAEFAAGAVIVSTTQLFNNPGAQETFETLAGIALVTQGEFNCYPTEANGFGAQALGVLPDRLPGFKSLSDLDAVRISEEQMTVKIPEEPGLDTHSILAAAAAEELDALWLLGCDPFEDCDDRRLVERALENLPFLVVQDYVEREVMAHASVVLPMAAPAEQDGTYTNMEGRIQRMQGAIPPPGDAKPAWRAFAEIALRMRPMTPYFNPAEIMEEIAQVAPEFGVAEYQHLPTEGRRLSAPVTLDFVNEPSAVPE